MKKPIMHFILYVVLLAYTYRMGQFISDLKHENLIKNLNRKYHPSDIFPEFLKVQFYDTLFNVL